MPQVRRGRPVRRQLRGLRRRLRPHRAQEPYSAVSGAKPVLRTSEHYFFRLSDPQAVEFLREWTQGSTPTAAAACSRKAANKMKEWLGEAGENKLSDWDISATRPTSASRSRRAGQVLLRVWLDAPIGYFASFKNLADKRTATSTWPPSPKPARPPRPAPS